MGFCGSDYYNQSVRFSMSYMTLLTKGKNYYETIGYKPVETKLYLNVLKKNNTLMNSLKYSDIKDLLLKYDIDPVEHFSSKTSAKTVFKNIFNTKCIKIAKCLQLIVTDLKLIPLQGIEFQIKF